MVRDTEEKISTDMFGYPVRIGDEIVRGARNGGLRRHFVIDINSSGRIGTGQTKNRKSPNAWVSPSELINLESLKIAQPSLFI